MYMEKECYEWNLTTVDPQERSTWRSGVRSAMGTASQLPGKGPTDVDDAPCTCTLIKNPNMILMMISYPSVLIYALGAQKSRLIETVLLSTHNICFD